MEGKLPGIEKEINALGITTNGRGLVFVSDLSNSCIHMFSTTGQHLGILGQNEDLGRLGRITWCEDMSSIFTSVFINKKWNLQVINVL